MAALDILNDLVDAGDEDLIRSVYKEFSLSWQKKIVVALNEMDENVIAVILKNEE